MKTPDSVSEHTDPNVPPRPTNKDRKWVTPHTNAKPLVTDPKLVTRQVDRYLDAILERDRLTPLSELGASYRALDRNGDTHIAQHYRVIGETFDRLPTHRLGKLNPSFAAFDPGLPRQIKQAARDGAHASRFDTSAAGDNFWSERTGAHGQDNARRPLRPNQKPREKSRQIFYLPRHTELSDTIGARSIAGEAIHATKRETALARRSAEINAWEGVETLLTLCASVEATGVAAIASAVKRLDPSPEILGAVYRQLGHSNRRKLAKLLK